MALLRSEAGPLSIKLPLPLHHRMIARDQCCILQRCNGWVAAGKKVRTANAGPKTTPTALRAVRRRAGVERAQLELHVIESRLRLRGLLE